MIVIGIGFIIVILMIYGLLSFVFMGFMSSSNKKTQKNAESILDETFDGKDTAVYKISNLGGLEFEQVLAGGENRGYSLHAQNESRGLTTMVFKKTHESVVPTPQATPSVQKAHFDNHRQPPGQGKFFDVKPSIKDTSIKDRLIFLGCVLAVILALPFIMTALD